MLLPARLDAENNLNHVLIKQFIIDAALTVCFTHNIKLGSSPGATVFGRDMLFDHPYLLEQKAIECKCEWFVNDANVKKTRYQ